MRAKLSSITLIAGISAVIVYLTFTTISLFKYPAEYSPLTNWLSDLGNPQVNISGAVFYNLGCILASLILLPFFFSLQEWNTGDKKIKRLLTIAQISGLLSSIFLIITALFPLGPHTSVHAMSGKIHIIFAGFFFSFSATVFLKHSASIKWFSYFGIAGALANFIYGAILQSVYVAEWVAIGMFIIYVLMISYNSKSLPSKN